jgi:methylmalonyl-CoA/ethylmalonyl-CoA epimerase
VDLHHVALATRDAGALVEPLVGELGGVVMMGGDNVGFRSYQVRLGDATDGMTLELLEPWEPERFDFLERFVVRHGEGPHHLTFKVTDLAATIERVRTSGYTPVGISLSDPGWKEAFLQPREAHGTVVQLAQAASTFPDFAAEFAAAQATPHREQVWWPAPPPAAAVTTTLRRVVMTTPSLDAALGFFAGLLEGTIDGTSDGTIDGAGRAWTELRWPGGGRVRLEEDRSAIPRVDRLELETTGRARELQLAGTRLVVRSVDDPS